MAGFTSTIEIAVLFIACMIVGTNATNNTTQFDNFTIEWESFSLFTCGVPSSIVVSLFTCLPAANYSMDEVDCLTESMIDFDQTTCQGTTSSFLMTSSPATTTPPITTVTTTPVTTTTPSSSSSSSSSSQITTVTSSTTNNQLSTTTTPAATYPAAVTTVMASQTATATAIMNNVQTSDTSTTGYAASSLSLITSSGSTTGGTGSTRMMVTTNPGSIAPLTAPGSTMAPAGNIYDCHTDTYIGISCNISSDPCAMSQPCHNAATCFPNNTLPFGYYCQCASGYIGYNCETDNQACREGTCWHNGTCIPGNASISANNGSFFECECIQGYNGVYCELKINLCDNITCENRGICQTVEFQWKCLCLDSSMYYGDHCQYKTSKLRLREILSKSFASIAIGAIVATCTFIVVMDILKYAFHIDPVQCERESYRKRREERKRARQPIKNNELKLALRFQYVS